jgi:hypothetical protein
VPYIVATKRPPEIPVLGSINEPALAAKGVKVERGSSGLALAFVSRRAVATLEEARQIVAAKLPTDASVYDLGLPDSGTVTLPDGTVIEVEPVLWHTLAAIVGEDGYRYRGEHQHAEILDAFNTQASGHGKEMAK